MRTLERPEEGHALREMRLEGLEGVLEHTRNGALQARDAGDVRKARMFRRQHDRAAAELLARRLERQQNDRQEQEDEHGR